MSALDDAVAAWYAAQQKQQAAAAATLVAQATEAAATADVATAWIAVTGAIDAANPGGVPAPTLLETAAPARGFGSIP